MTTSVKITVIPAHCDVVNVARVYQDGSKEHLASFKEAGTWEGHTWNGHMISIAEITFPKSEPK